MNDDDYLRMTERDDEGGDANRLERVAFGFAIFAAVGMILAIWVM